MQLLWFSFFLCLMGCTSPVYENTTYGIEEFMADSTQISQGKQAILALEKREEDFSTARLAFEETLIDGDELTIALYCPRRPDRVAALQTINQKTGFQVCDGKICLPHLSSLEVEGLTLNEVKERIQDTYREQLPDAQIFVNFKKLSERQVQIIGAGKSMVTVDGGMCLSEVLAKARLPPNVNLFKSMVMRNEQQLPVDLYKLIHEGDESQNIMMRGGDHIFIANESDATVMVTGEVPQPQVIPIPYGFLSLREALVIAGGIPFTGNKSSIQVIRGNLTRPKVYCLLWQDITHLSNQSLLLMPGDVVVIGEKPITQWNRFIDQLQPSTAAMQGGYNTYELFRPLIDRIE